MTDDAQGNYSLPNGYKAVTGAKVLPSNHNPPLEDLGSSMTARYMRDGRAPMLGDVPMGNHKITGLKDGANDDEAVNKGQLDATLPLAGGTMTGQITFNLTASANTKLIDLMQGYGIYSDNIGTNGTTRVWFDAPDNGEFIFGPRSGASSLAWLRVRADLTTIEGSVTTTGPVTLPGNPTANLQAAAKQYVDAGDAKQIGVEQSWQNVKVSRAAGTTYQNTTGAPIMVALLGLKASGNFGEILVSANNSSWVTLGAFGNGYSHVSFIVPHGHYYKIEAGTTVQRWAELR